MIRKLTLEEWFLMHQLNHIQRNHFHFPLELDADITQIAEIYRERKEKPPWTAILIKAAGLLAEVEPVINQMYFATWLGGRKIVFPYIAVNLPVMIQENGISYLSAMTIQEPQLLKNGAIQKQIIHGKSRKIKDLPIGRWIAFKRNTFLNRSRLRMIHAFIYLFPSIYLNKKGGGISVSSVLNVGDSAGTTRPQSFGATGFTITASSIRSEADGKTILKIGVGYDHYAFSGFEAMKALTALGKILSGENPSMLEKLCH